MPPPYVILELAACVQIGVNPECGLGAEMNRVWPPLLGADRPLEGTESVGLMVPMIPCLWRGARSPGRKVSGPWALGFTLCKQCLVHPTAGVGLV